jgi:hypothetical protein
MYTCNTVEATVCCEQGTLQPKTAPPEHDRTATELLWPQRGLGKVIMFQKVTISPSSTASRSPSPPELSLPASNTR